MLISSPFRLSVFHSSFLFFLVPFILTFKMLRFKLDTKDAKSQKKRITLIPCQDRSTSLITHEQMKKKEEENIIEAKGTKSWRNGHRITLYCPTIDIIENICMEDQSSSILWMFVGISIFFLLLDLAIYRSLYEFPYKQKHYDFLLFFFSFHWVPFFFAWHRFSIHFEDKNEW